MTDDNLIDFKRERNKRLHLIHDRKLEDLRQVFEQALPLPGKSKKADKKKRKPKKS